mgnify:CR=1 FL=1|jgi:hypothetical protein
MLAVSKHRKEEDFTREYSPNYYNSQIADGVFDK